MDKQTGMIMDLNVPHVGVACNSARVKLDGLKNVLQRLYDNVINISSLTTDRHKQVRFFFRKSRKIFDISLMFGILLKTLKSTY